MGKFIRRAALICAAIAFGTSTSALTAQQTSPEQAAKQSSTNAPPAPPTDMQTAPGVPPPFPPMPSRAPSHRWVDMGDHHRSHQHHRSTARVSHREGNARQQASHSHHRATSNRTAKSHHRASHHRAGPTLSKKTIRRCHKMTYHQLLQHKDCAQLLQSELRAAAHSKHRSANRKSAAKHHHKARTAHHKVVHRRETGHSRSARRHRP